MTQNSIIVQTSIKREIDNFQNAELFKWHLCQVDDQKKRHPNAIERSKPNPQYNCHGQTFASRRTGISDSKEVQKILADDNYFSIPKDEVLPGDIVLYISDDNDIIHSGTVMEICKNSLWKSFLILSKWGYGCEMIHNINDCPYLPANIDFRRLLKK